MCLSLIVHLLQIFYLNGQIWRNIVSSTMISFNLYKNSWIVFHRKAWTSILMKTRTCNFQSLWNPDITFLSNYATPPLRCVFLPVTNESLILSAMYSKILLVLWNTRYWDHFKAWKPDTVYRLTILDYLNKLIFNL